MENSDQRRHHRALGLGSSSSIGSLDQLEQRTSHVERVRRRLGEPCPHEGDTPSSRMAARGWQALRSRLPIINVAALAREPMPAESGGGISTPSSPWAAVGKRFFEAFTIADARSILRRRNVGQPTTEMSEGRLPTRDRPSDRASAHPSGSFTAREKAKSARRPSAEELGQKSGSRRGSTANAVHLANVPPVGRVEVVPPPASPTPIGDCAENGDVSLHASARQPFAPHAKPPLRPSEPHSQTGRSSSSSIGADAAEHGRPLSLVEEPSLAAAPSLRGALVSSGESSDLHSDSEEEEASPLAGRRRSGPRRWDSGCDGDTGSRWPLDLLPYLGHSSDDTAGGHVGNAPQHIGGAGEGSPPPLSVRASAGVCAPPPPGFAHGSDVSPECGSAIALTPAVLQRARSTSAAPA
jgi:hypothetical protein